MRPSTPAAAPSRWRLLVEKIMFFGEKSATHGVPNFVRTDRWLLKIIWFLSLIVFTYFCASFIIISFFNFFAFEVNTNIEVVRDSDADFPTVSICILQVCTLDNAPASASSAYKSTYLPWAVHNTFNQSGKLTQAQLDANMSSYNLETLIEASRQLFLSNYSRSELNSAFPSNKTSIRYNIISCMYSSEYCYENDFAWFQVSEFQKCYKFNSGKNFNSMDNETVGIKKARRYGKNYGLQLEMFIGLPDQCKSPLMSQYGVILYVHNSSTTISYDTNGISLSPGMQTNVAIDRTFVTKLPAPYSTCVPNVVNSSYPNDMVRDTFRVSNYTQFTCMQICYQRFLLTNYGCYDRYLPMVDTYKYNACALIMDSINNTIYYDKNSFYAQQKDEECQNMCPVECEFVTYDKTASSSQFPSVTYSEVLSYNMNVTDNFVDYRGEKQFSMIESSVLAVNVFYKNDLYTRIMEKPALEWDKWISNIGGNLGLFLGAGFLTLVEMFEMIIELILVCVVKHKDYDNNKKILVQPFQPAAQF